LEDRPGARNAIANECPGAARIELARRSGLPQAVASPTIPSWNQIAGFIASMRQLRDRDGRGPESKSRDGDSGV